MNPRAQPKPSDVNAAAANSSSRADDRLPLRILTFSSSDDGKATLIPRLLNAAGSAEGDEHEAQREDGPVAAVDYRHFSTPQRRFIVADTPGDEQHTLNIVAGASHSDLAVILIDAGKSLTRRARRQSCIIKLFGIDRVVLAVDKMDLVDDAKDRFRQIDQAYRKYAHELAIADVTAIPLSGSDDGNIRQRSSALSWYDGPTLLDHLESIDILHDDGSDDLRPAGATGRRA